MRAGLQGGVRRAAVFSLLLLLGVAGCKAERSTWEPGVVDDHRLTAAATDSVNWLSYGRTYDEQRFSPLDQVNVANVGKLGLAWYADMDTDRGQEATPIVVDGRIYVSTAWSMVKAYDAVTGKPIWSYDPQVPREWAVNACCDVVNRGVAVWGGKVYIGTLDGRLVALDADTGTPVWSVLTIDKTKPYTITGAPRIVKGKVLIGNGGAEYGVRGYVSAYDAETGKQAWRFFTVPGDPTKPFENAAMAAAAKTWRGRWWELGGGGTVWDAMAYDPELDLLYIGTGNGSPWNRKIRSAGYGDNLYLSSIVALRPETGEYVWHYQTTPGDEWDYTATQHIMLADLIIDGAKRKVLMQAPKNGFFYVLDRVTGKLISAKPFAPVNWATGVDMKTGRPIENPAARYSETGRPWPAMPGPLGAHSWYPMSFSPKTGLVYLPEQEVGTVYVPIESFERKRTGWNTGEDLAALSLPDDPKVHARIRRTVKGHLIAWDPVNQREVWRVAHTGAFNGGTLATAGGLVFQGDADGKLWAYRAENGARIWSFDAQSPIMAPPVAYSVGGVQYIAVMVGYGGVAGLGPGALFNPDRTKRNISRLLVFRLDGNNKLPSAPVIDALGSISAPPPSATPSSIAAGQVAFGRSCSVCHGGDAISAGVIRDLRYSGAIASKESFAAIVIDGALKDIGMASFADTLPPPLVEDIRQYLLSRALAARKAEKK